MRGAARVMHDTGLSALFTSVNSDDCWALPSRGANGSQQADPAVFPEGFAATVAYIASLNMTTGLYTARGSNTCDARAGSCGHEALDAATYAAWGISYIKVCVRARARVCVCVCVFVFRSLGMLPQRAAGAPAVAAPAAGEGA